MSLGGDSAAERAYSTQEDIARDLWDQYTEHATPIISELSEDALGPVSRAEEAAEAGRVGADVDQAYDRATEEFRGGLGRYGLNPGSGRYAGGLRSLALGRAADRSGAMTGARRHLKDRKRAAQFGTLAALSGQPGQALSGLSSAASGYGAIAGREQQADQFTRSLDQQAEQFKTEGQWMANRDAADRRAQRQAGWGSLLGTGLTAAATWFSDPRIKDDLGTVGDLDSGVPIHLFKYKDDDKIHLGVMADEAAEVRPEAVGRHKSGLAVVDYMKVAA